MVTTDATPITNKELQVLDKQRIQQAVGILWMRGYQLTEICDSLQLTPEVAISLVRANRAQIAEWYKDELSSLRGERIDALRRIQRQAQEEIDIIKLSNSHNALPNLLSILLKAETTIATIQGVMETHTKSEVTHIVKQYDFDADKVYPQQADITIIEAGK